MNSSGPIILIVDDVLENIRLLKNLLADFGQIVFASDGLAALEQAQRHRPDIVLLDVMMPGLDGYETCRRLKAHELTRDAVVLFVTGADAESDEAQGLAAGAIDYITKPFAPAIVRARVQNHLALVMANAGQKRMDAELRASHAQVAAQAAQLEIQNEALQENVRLREEVERISRHDLKTPLNSIIAVPRLLREKKRLDPEDDELLTIIERAGYRLLSMVNLSLDLFKMEQETYRFQPRAVDLLDLLGKLDLDLRGHSGARQVGFQLMPWNAPRADVWAEELLCYSLLANLMKNAFEASPEGGCVTARITRADGQLMLHLHNRGAVPEPVRARFFDKYATAGKAEGSGLGTYSARLMARAQGGDIAMYTSEQEGTTVVLRLQAAPEHEAAADAGDTLPRRRDAQPAADIVALKVLVVDDDEYNLLVMRRYMAGAPVAVHTATDGRAGLEWAMANSPDVIFMDLEMPGMHGLEATGRLRRHEQHQGLAPCMVVALSAHDDEGTRQRAIDAGCSSYLAKPASAEEVRALLLQASAAVLGHGAPAPALPAAAEDEGPGIDDDVLVDADLRDALPAFLQSRREAIDSMTLACAKHDVPEVRQLAHRLAGSFALYGFLWAGKHCQMLERDAAMVDGPVLHEELARLRMHLRNVTIRFIDLDDQSPPPAPERILP